MNYVDCWLFMLCEVINDMLVIYAMKMLIDAMYTRSILESCHKVLMELECIFILCNMPCNVGPDMPYNVRNAYVRSTMLI